MRTLGHILVSAALMAGTFGLLCVLGCAGPSKARYRTLLAECREQNQEHLRMLHEYERMCPRGPEQGSGASELGLGGW